MRLLTGYAVLMHSDIRTRSFDLIYIRGYCLLRQTSAMIRLTDGLLRKHLVVGDSSLADYFRSKFAILVIILESMINSIYRPSIILATLLVATIKRLNYPWISFK